jgi:predicted PurR-regulated permease PerM
MAANQPNGSLGAPMNRTDESALLKTEHRALLLLVVAVSLALGWVLLPFYGVLLWSVIVALLFAPLHRRLLGRMRHQRTLAALLTTLAAVVIAVVPFVLLSATLAHEAAGLYARIQSGETTPMPYLRGVFDALPEWAAKLLEHFGLADFDTLQRWLTTKLEQASAFIATQAFSLGQNTFEFGASLLITLYLAFFLIRDGDRIVHAMRRALPLTPAHKQELLDKFNAVIRSTVRGNMVVAGIQGALGGLAFWFLGFRGALLWAVVMAFLSLLPAIGAALVWLPVAIWLFVTGAIWQSIALAAWGMFVIGLVDNLLRPILVGKATLMPDYVVMITTLGGMVIFGINGFVLGPVIAAMFFAVWHLYLTTRQIATPPSGPSES